MTRAPQRSVNVRAAPSACAGGGAVWLYWRQWGSRGITKSFALESDPYTHKSIEWRPGMVDWPRAFATRLCDDMAQRSALTLVEQAMSATKARYALKRRQPYDATSANACLLGERRSRQITGSTFGRCAAVAML